MTKVVEHHALKMRSGLVTLSFMKLGDVTKDMHDGFIIFPEHTHCLQLVKSSLLTHCHRHYDSLHNMIPHQSVDSLCQ